MVIEEVLNFVFSFIHPVLSASTSKKHSEGKCELVGTFSLVTQAFLGFLCLLSLIMKRFYEYPERRTWQVWFFDVSKQVIGAMGVHVFNLFMSILKTQPDSGRLIQIGKNGDCSDSENCVGNPCDWYFLNIVLDCTIGVYVLYWVLRGVSHVCKRYLKLTQISSGEYGSDTRHPSFKAYFKQLGIYFSSLMITKFILYGLVECFESELVWFINHILLAWLAEYPNELEIFIVMFVVPVFMNSLQLVLVDNFIQNQAVHERNVRFSHFMHTHDYEAMEREIEALAKSDTHDDPQYNSTG